MFRTVSRSLILAAGLAIVPTGPGYAGPPPGPPPVKKVIQPVAIANMMVQVGPGEARVVGVQPPSFGQVGNVIFEVGDVIYSVGGVNVAPGLSLDALFNQAIATGNRYVTVRDKNSGQVVTIPF